MHIHIHMPTGIDNNNHDNISIIPPKTMVNLTTVNAPIGAKRKSKVKNRFLYKGFLTNIWIIKDLSNQGQK